MLGVPCERGQGWEMKGDQQAPTYLWVEIVLRDGQHLAWSSDQNADQPFEIENKSHEEALQSGGKMPGVGINKASELKKGKQMEDAQRPVSPPHHGRGNETPGKS